MPEVCITMSTKELGSFEVIQKVVNKQLKQKQVAQILALSARQIITLIKGLKANGDAYCQQFPVHHFSLEIQLIANSLFANYFSEMYYFSIC